MGFRLFIAFLVVVASALLLQLPIIQTTYDFRTDPRTDSFVSATTVAGTTANVILAKNIYDDDTGTIVFISDEALDAPHVSTFNASNRQLLVNGLAANTSRDLDVTYDIDALEASSAISIVIDRVGWFWLLLILMMAPAGLAAIFWDKMGRR